MGKNKSADEKQGNPIETAVVIGGGMIFISLLVIPVSFIGLIWTTDLWWFKPILTAIVVILTIVFLYKIFK